MNQTVPLVFGHRGACEEAPENTLKSFQLAIEQGADGIETDLQFTSDGRLVCFHDNDLRRLVGTPQEIRSLTYQELSAQVGECPDYQGEKIPTLTDLLDWRPQHCCLMLELKDDAFEKPEAVLQLKQQLESAGNMSRIWISSFKEPCLRSVRQRLPEIPYVWISRELIPLEDLWTDGYSPHVTILEKNPNLSTEYRSAGKFISVWDTHPEERVNFYQEQQISAVTPNSPRRWIEFSRGGQP